MVTLSNPDPNEIRVSYFTSNGTAIANSDYLPTNGVLIFPPGTTTATITVYVIGETNHESDEIFVMNLNNPINATLPVGQAFGTILNDDDAPIVSVGDLTLFEGSCGEIPISLSYTSSRTLSITYCLTNAPTNVFLVCASNCVFIEPTNVPTMCRSQCCTVQIPPGALDAHIQICAGGDGFDALGGDFGGFFGGDGRFPSRNNRVTFVDTNEPTILSTNAAILEGNSGLTNLCFTVRLTTPHFTNVWVDYFTISNSATPGEDFLAVTNTLLFPPGSTTQFVCVPIVGETKFETNESFFVVLTNAVNGILQPPNAVMRGTITNDDLPPRVTINDVTVVEQHFGTNLVTFTVSVLDPSCIPFEIVFGTIDVTATSAVDFLPTNSSVVFGPGVTNQTFTVGIIGDTYDELDETFRIRLTNLNTNSATLLRTNATGTILDDDPPEIRVFDAVVWEGPANSTTNLVFLVALTTATNVPVRVEFFTKDGSASSNVDYVPTNGVLVFDPGVTNLSVAVTVLGDTNTEVSEVVFLCLTNAINARIVDSLAEGLILEDDKPCISINDSNAIEGGTMRFTVMLDGTSSLTVSVDYATTNGSATNGLDYVGRSGTLTFPPGVTVGYIDIPILDDGDVETIPETFFVVLSRTNNARLCRATGRGEINDRTPPPILTVNAASVTEGGVGRTPLVFTATLSKPNTNQIVAVNYTTLSGTALSSLDFVPTNGTLRFAPGTTATNFTIYVVGDCEFEPTETLFVRLTNVQFAALDTNLVSRTNLVGTNLVVETNLVVGTILDDDPPPTVSITNVIVREGDLSATNAIFNLWLSCRSAFTACVDFVTIDGSASNGLDYAFTQGTVCFPPGATNATLSIPVFGDFEEESNETFYVTLTVSDPQTGQLATNRAVGTILDDDGIHVRFNPTNVSGLEGTALRFNLELSKPPSSPRSVRFKTVDNSAVGGPDYVPTNVLVMFAGGQTTQSVSVLTVRDGLDETNETFFGMLADETHLVIDPPMSVGTIIDNDLPCLSGTNLIVIDDGTNKLLAEFNITLSSTSPAPVSVNFLTADGTAYSGTDYVGTNGLVVFAPGVTNLTIPVIIKPNSQDETNEYFFMLLTNATNANVCQSAIRCTIVLQPNECPAVTWVSPSSNLCHPAQTALRLEVSPVDRDGAIDSVDFRTNGASLARLRAPPWTYEWSSVPTGDYLLRAVVTDNLFCSVTSAPVQISSRSPAVLSIGDAQVIETDTGTNMLFAVRLASPSCSTVKVEAVTANGSAVAPSDYGALLTSLVFNPGVTQQFVAVPIVGDTEIEPDETFQVILTNAVNASIATRVGTGKIINDDTNRSPLATITNIASGASFCRLPGVVPICAQAMDPEGHVRQVDFYAGTNLIGQTTQAPYCVPWTNTVAGAVVLRAVATDNVGTRGTSAPVTVTIVASAPLSVAPLMSHTQCVCESVTFTTTVTTTVPYAIAWKVDGRLISGATNTSLTLYSLKPADAGEYSVEVTTSCTNVTRTATLVLNGDGVQNPAVFVNSNRIDIADGGVSPPSVINVGCIPGRLQKVTVSVADLSHDWLGDVDMILVSPERKAIKLMSDVEERRYKYTNLFLTFTDDAEPMPCSGPIGSISYQPTDCPSKDSDFVPPGTTLVTKLADFIGDNPNGAWELYLADDAARQFGEIRQGWSLSLSWNTNAPWLSSPRMINNGLEFTLNSQPNRTHVIEGSTDLENWFALSTNVMIGTNMTLGVPRLPNHNYAFYRVIRCPCISPGCLGCVARLSAPTVLSNGQFQVVLNSAPGKSHVIEASTDLMNWAPVSTNTMTDKAISVVLPKETHLSRRFYRAIRCP